MESLWVLRLGLKLSSKLFVPLPLLKLCNPNHPHHLLGTPVINQWRTFWWCLSKMRISFCLQSFIIVTPKAKKGNEMKRAGWAHALFPYKIVAVFIWEGRLPRLPRSWLLEGRSQQAGQPAFSYKHNNNFARKQGMSRASMVKQARLAHLIYKVPK